MADEEEKKEAEAAPAKGAAPAEEAPKAKSKLPLIAGAVALVGILGGGGWFFFGARKGGGGDHGGVTHSMAPACLDSRRQQLRRLRSTAGVPPAAPCPHLSRRRPPLDTAL